MKQYNIPNGGYVPIKNVTYLLENDISQINRIPLLQNYSGYAIVTVGDVYVESNSNIEALIGDGNVIKNSKNNIFVINCAHESFKDDYQALKTKLNVDQFKSNDDIEKYILKSKIKTQYDVSNNFEEMHEELKKYCYEGN